eukprot:12924808-Prorocentrum_lima.AAC.1
MAKDFLTIFGAASVLEGDAFAKVGSAGARQEGVKSNWRAEWIWPRCWHRPRPPLCARQRRSTGGARAPASEAASPPT